MRKDLMTGGYDERDASHFSARTAARSLKNNLGLLASMGSTDTVLRRQLALAEEGCDFLLVHAPTREEVERVMNVVRRAPFRSAQKFHRFAIEDLE